MVAQYDQDLVVFNPQHSKTKKKERKRYGGTQKCVGRVISTIAAKFSKNKQKDHICLI